MSVLCKEMIKEHKKVFVLSYLMKNCNHIGMRIGRKDTKATEIVLYCVKR